MKVHLQGLTEIRGVAALWVLIAHIDQFSDYLNIQTTHLSKTGIAGFMVTTFFTLSGFLITYLLFEEQQYSNRINIKKFYVRRVLRIWPAYYLTICLSLVLILIGFFSFSDDGKLLISITGFVFMIPNVLYTFGLTLPATTPLWSIGVEEQFYLAWPWIVEKVQNLKIVIITGVVIYLVIKIIIFLIHPTGAAFALVKMTQFDCIAFGAYAAILSRNKTPDLLYHPITQVLSIVVLISPLLFPIQFFANLEIELYALASAIWILNTSMNSNAFISIKSAILRFFGRVSYGIYVYHFIWIYLIGSMNLGLNTTLTYLVVISVVTLFSYLSFELIEKRFLNLKRRFSIIESKG